MADEPAPMVDELPSSPAPSAPPSPSSPAASKASHKLSAAEEKRQAAFEAAAARMAEQGYTREDLTISLVKANVMAFVVMAPFVVVLTVLYLLLNPQGFISPSDLGDDLGESLFGFSFQLIVFAVGILVLAVVHEAIHGLTWGLCAEHRFKAIEFGVIWEMVTPYCTCSDPLRRWQYVLGAAMPTIVIGFIPAVVAAFIHSPLLFALAVVMVLGGGGDALIIIKILRHQTPAGSSTVYYDHPYECGLVAFTRMESRAQATHGQS